MGAARRKNRFRSQLDWRISWLMCLLPESCRADVIALKILLQESDMPAREVQKELLRAVLASYGGFIRNFKEFAGNFTARLNPQYTSQIYGIYGQEVIAKIEEEFLIDHYKGSLCSMRASGILIILFYFFFAILDIWCLPETKYISWAIKSFVILILSITTFLSFNSIKFEKFNQEITSISLLSAGVGIVLTIGVSHPNEIGYNSYYAALVLLYFYTYLMSGLRFLYAFWVGIGILIGYEIIIFFTRFSSIGTQDGFLSFVNNNLFLIMTLIAGSTACNLFERGIRLNFLIRYAIATSFRDFLHFFEYQDSKKFLNNISKIRNDPKQFEKFLFVTYDSTQRKAISQESTNIRSESRFLTAGEEIIDDIVDRKATETEIPNFKSQLKNASSWLFGFLKSINPTFSINNYKNIDPLLLREMERALLKDHFQSQYNLTRFSTVYSFIYYVPFIYVDIVYIPRAIYFSAFMRGLFGLYCIFVFLLSFRKSIFEKFHQSLVGVAAFMGGIGIVLMLAFSRPTDLGYSTYYIGLVLVLMYNFMFSGLLFMNAAIVGFLLVIGHTFITISFQNILESPDKIALFINNSIFLIIAYVIGAIACNFFERNFRSDFLTRYTIAYKAQELLAYHEHHKPTPKQLLDMINGIRHSPKKLEEFLMELLKFQRD
ncbi:MAG: hypothetical protein ACKO7W_02555 [Elainella sp.]